MNKTIIYYTSNREDPDFEERVRENILKTSTLPIVSVSQRPINFGRNICIGEVGVSGFNMCRQVQIACEEAKTDFVISAEADCLYPPDYFDFNPARKDVCYRNTNLYVMGLKRDYFFRKPEGATHAQVIGREYYLDRLKFLFKGAPQWSTEEKNFPKERGYKFFDEFEYYQTTNPVVQIKTDKAMRQYTHSDRTPIYNINYWGDSKKFRKRYLNGLN